MTPSNFEIIEKISESLTTKVYKARQPSLDRIVLLKTLHKNLVGDAGLLKRFEREAKACAMLRSEHIVQVYHLDEYDGAPAIVIEYVEGTALDELLAKHPKQSEEFALTVAQGVLKALVVAHGAGVVHRDIKPGNILIARDGTVKVADFGLATVATAPTLTMEGAMMGTPAYMSPEQSQGKQAKAASDLFSLGTTLVEVLTGERLFDGDSYAVCLNKISRFAPEMLDRLAESMSPRTLSFLKRLMMPQEEHRFESAATALQFIRRRRHATTNMFGVQTGSRVGSARSYGKIVAALLVVGALLVALNQGWLSRSPAPEKPTPLMNEQRSIDSLKSSTSGVSHDTLVLRTKTQSVGMPAVPVSRGSDKQVAGTLNEKTMAKQAADSGYLQVACNPWAKVYLGNEYIGTTPIAGTLKVRAGIHTLTFQNESYPPIVKTVAIEPGTLESIEADFFANTGFIFVSVMPWADVYIDDQQRGTTPMSRPLLVSAGTRKVRLHHPAFEDIISSVVVAPRDTVRVVHTFNKRAKN